MTAADSSAIQVGGALVTADLAAELGRLGAFDARLLRRWLLEEEH